METNLHNQTPVLLSVHDIAIMLRCSPKTILRMCDTGQIPQPICVGMLVRWNRQHIEQWIEQGCPRVVNQ